MPYDSEQVWITRIIERVCELGVPGRWMGNLVSVGAVPLLLSVVYFRLATVQPTDRFLAGHVLLAVMLSAVGYLIWYYDEQLLEGFFGNLEGLLANEDDLVRTAEKYSSFFAHESWKTTLWWAPLGPIAFWGNRAYLAQQGVGTPGDLVFWVYALFALVASLYTSVGIHAILTTLLTVREVSTLEFQIDPLNTDGAGGMRAIGWFSVRTMGLASVGSLAMPFVFQLVVGGSFDAVLYFALGVYVVLLVAIFFYPTIIAQRRAEETRESQLESYRREIDRLEAELAELTSDTANVEEMVAKQLELQRLKQKYDEYDSVTLYPLSIGVVTRFAGSILLPLGFLLLELYLPKLV